MKSKQEKRAFRERGQSLVEAAIALPLLLLLLMGIMEYGWYFYNQLNVENGSREGARYGIVHTDSVTFTADVTEVVNEMLTGPGTVSVTVTKTTTYVTVKVVKAIPTLTPLAAPFAENGTFTLTSAATMKI